MAMLRGTFSSKLLVEGLREVFFLQYDEKSLIYPQIFDVRTSKKERETDRSVAGLSMPVVKQEGTSVTYEDFVDGLSVAHVKPSVINGESLTRRIIGGMITLWKHGKPGHQQRLSLRGA